MRYERTDSFKADFRGLSKREQELFRAAARTFNDACDASFTNTSERKWPTSLRVKPVQGASGIFEMTWSFSGPDGRATWEWTTITGDNGTKHPAVRWRRIGNHRIFGRP